MVEEERPGDPLAHRPTLEVGEGHDHGVDVARLDLVGERLEREHVCTLTQRHRIVQRYSGVT